MKRIVSTGVPHLDLLLAGGIPARQCVVVTGDPGTGKTILCSQIAFAHAARGESVVLATVASESQDKLIDELQEFSFFDRERIGRELFVVSAYSALQRGPKEAKELLLSTMRSRKAKLLFLDGLRSVRDLWAHEGKLRDFLYELNVGIAHLDAIGLLTTEYPLSRLMEYPEATTVDGIVSLTTQRFGGRVVRRIQVVKLRGRGHLGSEHVMHINANGICIVPRLEDLTIDQGTFAPSVERAGFGLPELDVILQGGLPRLSATLLAGSTGVGKTLLGAQFIAAGARKNERGLLVTYSEPVQRLISRARGVSLELQPLVDAGMALIEYRIPTNLEADDLIAEILKRVRDHGIKRLVLDGIGELETSILEPARVKGLLTSLIIQLRDLGVTAVFIKEVPKFAGPELDFSDTPISVTAENVLFFRYIELRGRLRRILSVLKMRESGYEPYVHEFQISSGGVTVLGPLDSAEGLLTGMARPLSPAYEERDG